MYLGSDSILSIVATNKSNGTDLRHRKENKSLNGIKIKIEKPKQTNKESKGREGKRVKSLHFVLTERMTKTMCQTLCRGRK